jgi:glycosyltransferase involved in cell wall biosynthesis
MPRRSRPRPDLLLIGPLSGTLTGVVVATQAVLALAQRSHSIEIRDVAAASLERTPAYHLRRLARYARATWSATVHDAHTIYLAADGGQGLLYALGIAAAARLRRRTLVVHHHSFAYVNQRSKAMGAFTRIAPLETRHLFLCDTMRAKFSSLYGRGADGSVLSNAVLLPPHQPDVPRHEHGPGSFSVGHLSNLSVEKGLGVVADLARALDGSDLRIVVAGPRPDGADSHLLEEPVEYVGPVYGDEKQRFFEGLDAFVFPSSYVNEAEPFVILEALAAGVPVLATPRGCVGAILPSEWICDRDQFIGEARAILRGWQQDPEAHRQARDRARSHVSELRSAGHGSLSRLLADTRSTRDHEAEKWS